MKSLTVSNITVTPPSMSHHSLLESGEYVIVTIDDRSIDLCIKPQGGGSATVRLTNEQALEVMSALGKAVEVREEYVREAKALEEERKALEKKYRDIINGDGLGQADFHDERSPFKVTDSNFVLEG